MYVFVLSDGGMVAKVATIKTHESKIAAVYFDRESGYLWSVCDDSCDGKHHVFTLNGTFTSQAEYERPAGLGNYNNEGYAIATGENVDVCKEGMKFVYWADDGCDESHAIRQGTIPCSTFL